MGALRGIVVWVAAVVGLAALENYFFKPPVAPGSGGRAIEEHLVRKIEEAAEKGRIGSAAVVLVHHGEIAAAHGVGLGNAHRGTPVDLDRTLYQVASVSKAVTAWGVMKLVQDGKIGLDEPVTKYLRRWRFPGSEAYRDKVTARQLLSHTAGLDDAQGYVPLLGDRIPQAEWAAVAFRSLRIAREPGTGMAYSSAGYAVLQLLIEDVTQQPFAAYMKRSVLLPLGMTRSGFGREGPDVATAFDGDVKPADSFRYTATAPVALHATARDLGRFVQAFIRENCVLSRSTLRLMLEAQPGTSGTWGLGHTIFAGQVVGHDGGTYPAWGAMVRVNPATGNGMVLLVSGGRGTLNQLGHDWIYWETGMITPSAKRQQLYSRIRPAVVAVLLGAVVIVMWSVLRRNR